MVRLELAPTAQASINYFFSAVSTMRRRPASIAGASAVVMEGVGLRIEGRSSAWQLWWNPRRPYEFYALDLNDVSYVARAAFQ